VTAFGADVRPPGIYSEPSERAPEGLALGRTGVLGILGLAQRGPTDRPVRISSPEEFREVFGELREGGFLQAAIEGFFKNGGQEAWVVRVAHRFGLAPGDPAAVAACTLTDGTQTSRLFLRALSEGSWGNDLRVSIDRPPPQAQTFLTLDAEPGDTSVTVRSTHNLRPGVLVRIQDGRNEAWRHLVSIEGKRLSFREDQPLETGFSASAPTEVETVDFRLRVQSPFRKEVFADLSLNPASPQFIERVVAERSRLIAATVIRRPGELDRPPTAEDLPAAVEDLPLAGGADGLWNVTPDDFVGMSGQLGGRTGLGALEQVPEVDLLAAPDVLWLFQRNAGVEGMPFSTRKDVEMVHEAMLAAAERLNDRFVLLDSPFPESLEATREYRLSFDSRQGALYFPWLVQQRDGRRHLQPPSGHIAGLIARCDRAIGVHRPPANDPLEDVEDLSFLVREEDMGLLNAEGINCLVSQGTRGIRPWGARTVSSDPSFRYINVRREINAIQKVLGEGLQWVVFEPNLPGLWKTVNRLVTDFLMKVWRQGWFRGETPEEAFFVQCDEENNPPEERDAGRLLVEVGVAPVRPTEFLVLRLAQEMQEKDEGA